MPKHHKGSTGVCQAYNGKILFEFTFFLKIIFFRVLCTYTMYIYHIHLPFSSSHQHPQIISFPASFPLCFIVIKTPESNEYCPFVHAHAHVAIHQGRNNLPASTCLKESDFRAFTSYQLPIAPLIRVGPQPCWNFEWLDL